MMQAHKTRHLYANYLLKHPESTVTRAQFEQVLRKFFAQMIQEILGGYVFRLGYHLSSISIQKVKRSYKKPRINLPATQKLWKEQPELKEQGVKVFYTDQPFWYRFYWNKKHAQLKNKTVYRFDPTKGPKGNSRKLSRRIQTDPFAHLLYPLQ